MIIFIDFSKGEVGLYHLLSAVIGHIWNLYPVMAKKLNCKTSNPVGCNRDIFRTAACSQTPITPLKGLWSCEKKRLIVLTNIEFLHM